MAVPMVQHAQLVPKSGLPVSQFKTNYTQQYLAHQAQETSIATYLKAKAIYDAATEVSYIYELPPQDMDTLAVAARSNIFFAKPNSLVVYIPNDNPITLAQLQGE